MERRDFIRKGVTTGAATLALPASGFASPPGANRSPHGGGARSTRAFKLDYAPHFGMFENHAGEGLVSQLEFAAEQGFSAWEDNRLKDRDVEVQERIASAMKRLDMRMGVFVAHSIAWDAPNFASGDRRARKQFLREIRTSVEVAKRMGATWMTVVPGRLDPGLEMGYQTANVIETLRQASTVLEPHDLIMVLEPLNPWTNHPGMFLQRIPQAYQICQAVDSPSCKILFDLYHQQITEGNLIPNIDRAREEIAYFQIGDNPGRNEPTTGEINYENIFEYIYSREYGGILGMEHGNSKPGVEGEQAVIDAYVSADSFEPDAR